MSGNTALLDFVQRYGYPAGEDGPVLFVREVLGANPDPWQVRILRAYGRGERRISVRSCHGPGKTAVAAWLILLNLCTRFPQKTVATAPTAGQLQDALVGEVKLWLKMLPPLLQQNFDVQSSRIEFLPDRERSFFVARTSRAEKPEALQGVHMDPGHVLLIVDEASGVPEEVYKAAIGSMSQENATTLLISNPVRTTGLFFDTFHKLKDMWFTVHVSHTDSPRVSDDFVEDVARRYGRDSNEFRVRALGEFPAGDDDTVIPFSFVESARNRDIVADGNSPRVWGLDVARFGKDKTCLLERTNRGVAWIEVWEKRDTMETAGRVKAKWDAILPHQRPQKILVDVIGLGAGVVDRLRELGLPVVGINVGETAAASERYNNARSELWWKVREWLEKAESTLPKANPGMDPREDPAEMLATELRIPKYSYTSSGKVQVESKDSIKARGFPSPNVADALCLTFAEDLTLLVHGARGGSTSWNEPIKRGLPVV